MCCSECYEYDILISETDYKQAQQIIRETSWQGCKLQITDPDRMGDERLARYAQSKVYEYLCEAGYGQFIMARSSLKPEHPLPVGLQLYINKCTGSGTQDFVALYSYRVAL